jgi:hypothetical protein
MFPFCENVFVPGKSPVKVQPEILGIFFLGSWIRLLLFSIFKPVLDLVFSFYEAMAGSLSVASTAIS